MPKLSGPLMSIDAAGTFKQTMTFGIAKGTNWVRPYTHATPRRTTAQATQRNLFKAAIASWKVLTDE